MKRSLTFKLVFSWCALYAFMLLGSVSKLLRAPAQSDGLSLVLGLLPFALMLSGTIGLYRGRRWAFWLCAVVLALLTAWLPFGYRRLISAGGHPGPLLVVFSTLAAANMAAVAYLVRDCYRASRLKVDEKP